MPAATVVSFFSRSASVVDPRGSEAREPAAPLRRIPLSVRLEEETVATRREAEQTPFLRTLFRGTWGGSVYGQLVRGRHYVTYLQCLLEVYEALEDALELLCSHPIVGGFLLPELWRSQALEDDLCSFLGGAWSDAPRPTHLAALHVERIRQLSVVAPHLLVAHAYVRYTRDILAGPSLRSQAERAFDLSKGEGTAFYQAAEASSLDVLRRLVSRRLDSLPLSDEGIREMVREARLAFRLDTLLADALAREAFGMGSPSVGR